MINKVKNFEFYYKLCRQNKQRLEKLIAQTHMHLLLKAFKTSFKDLTANNPGTELQDLAKKYKMSEFAVLEIFILGRFMENLAIKGALQIPKNHKLN